MSKNKNFKINRIKGTQLVRARDVKIGDMFEREGSLHMRVNNCISKSDSPDKIWICNLNTGSVWTVPDDEMYVQVKNCEISYRIED
jgi:hypothetical protein